ncbi:MAG: DNA gyrase subunit A, partial [Fuerstiella sp.]|nr:DNA gyrase subunit A [Fuerstiella sp.]
GINLIADEEVVGMVVAEISCTLLTVCELGYGKRTPFGTGLTGASEEDETEGEGSSSSTAQYRRQRRGGKGLRDIKTTARNGKVVDAMAVRDNDEVLIVTSKGKIQRLRASDISTIGRNTQGVRIMKLDDGDTLASCAVIASEDIEAEAAKAELRNEAAAQEANSDATTPETTTPDAESSDDVPAGDEAPETGDTDSFEQTDDSEE